MAQAEGRIRQAFEAAQNLGPGQQSSKAQELREVTLDLDPSDSEAVRLFYDHMPNAVREFDEWKREAARLVIKTSQAGSFLTMAFTSKYTDNEIYDDFISESFTNEMERLRSEIAHNKVIDGMKLAQDAARNFAWWQKFHGEASSNLATVTSLAGVTSIVAGAALELPLLLAAGPVAVPVVAFQLWFGWDRVARNKEGKINLRDAALTLSDITESIQQDIRLLDEIGVYVANVATCQQKVRRAGRFNNLQKDKIVISARKMEEASNRYTQRDKTDVGRY